jgi:universal stress protein A
MMKIEKILCPVDFSNESNTSLELAQQFAELHSAQLLLVSVVPEPIVVPPSSVAPLVPQMASTDELKATAKRKLIQLAAKRVPSKVGIHLMVAVGDPTQRILDIAREQCPDLIVVATHDNPRWQKMLIGSVAESIIREAPCPVLSTKKSFSLSNQAA